MKVESLHVLNIYMKSGRPVASSVDKSQVFFFEQSCGVSPILPDNPGAKSKPIFRENIVSFGFFRIGQTSILDAPFG